MRQAKQGDKMNIDEYGEEEYEPEMPTNKQLHEHDLRNEKHDREDWTLY